MFNLKWNKRNNLDIIKMYKNGLSAECIGKKYNVNRSTILNIIKKSKITRSLSDARKIAIINKRTPQCKLINKKNKIIKMYKNGISMIKLAKIYKVSRQPIKLILKDIKKRTISESTKLATPRGDKHYLWISNRNKLKQNRRNSEEINFFKEILKERNYTCELTKQLGGKLSVHHIKPVWKYPQLKFKKNNVIVIRKLIHKKFHILYGFKSNEQDWKYFVNHKEYLL
jgi:predicted DNA-binding protein YlxM (UPF0122 family)